jgi:nicastrin
MNFDHRILHWLHPKSPAALDSFPKHILYTFFASEAWAFSGSDRFVQDIRNFQCQNTSNSCSYDSPACTFPRVRDLNFMHINFDKIDSLWHLDAIAQSLSSRGSNNKAFYLHVDDSQLRSPLVEAFGSVIANSSTQFSMLAANSDGVERRLPPSSVMSFLKVNRCIPAVVVSDYQASFDKCVQIMLV